MHHGLGSSGIKSNLHGDPLFNCPFLLVNNELTSIKNAFSITRPNRVARFLATSNIRTQNRSKLFPAPGPALVDIPQDIT